MKTQASATAPELVTQGAPPASATWAFPEATGELSQAAVSSKTEKKRTPWAVAGVFRWPRFSTWHRRHVPSALWNVPAVRDQIRPPWDCKPRDSSRREETGKIKIKIVSLTQFFVNPSFAPRRGKARES